MSNVAKSSGVAHGPSDLWMLCTYWLVPLSHLKVMDIPLGGAGPAVWSLPAAGHCLMVAMLPSGLCCRHRGMFCVYRTDRYTHTLYDTAIRLNCCYRSMMPNSARETASSTCTTRSRNYHPQRGAASTPCPKPECLVVKLVFKVAEDVYMIGDRHDKGESN